LQLSRLGAGIEASPLRCGTGRRLVERKMMGAVQKLAQRKAIGGLMGSARIASFAAIAALAVSALALAGPPGASLIVNGNNEPIGAGTATAAPGVYNWIGSDIGAGYITTWNFNGANSNETSPVFLSGNFTFTNTGLVTTFFDVFVNLETFPIGRTSSLVGGSVAAGLTADGDGGTLSSLGETPVWTSYVDAAQIAALLPGPISTSAGPFGSATLGSDQFGVPIPSMVGPALGNSMTIRLRFSLTAGDQASFTSVFVLQSVPAPAGLALLGLAGLTGRRRRA
jgi:hypothetical protein